jgi:hypothetical protein
VYYRMCFLSVCVSVYSVHFFFRTHICAMSFGVEWGGHALPLVPFAATGSCLALQGPCGQTERERYVDI